MVIRRLFILAIMISSFTFATAQHDSIIDNGLLKANFTFSIGFIPNQKSTNLYLNGNLEYFIERNISLRSDVYLFLDTEQDSIPTLKKNHTVLLGGLYHFPTKKFDPFLGIQPGLSISQIRYDKNNESTLSKIDIAPVFSVFTGVNYYVNDYFNFYFSIRYIKGKSFADLPKPFKLNEFRLTGGLGFHFQSRKN